MTNLAAGLEATLDGGRLGALRECAAAAERAGADLYLVGGVVRDLVMAASPPDPDLDIAGPRVDRAFAAGVARALRGRLVASSEFGTHKLAVPGPGGELGIDLVRCRSEAYAEPGALPSVTFSGLSDDLARRDFSIGAMALVLSPAPGSALSWGDLVDPFDGAGDAARRVVRVLHELSFSDDPTRIFRAVRYASRLGFAIDPETAALMRGGLGLIERLSGDRVRHELERFFDEPCPGAALAMARDLGVLDAAHPGMGSAGALEEASPAPGPEGWDEWVCLLACGLTEPSAKSMAERLNLGARSARAVRDAARIGAGALAPGSNRPSEVHAALSPMSAAAVRACAASTADPVLRSVLDAYLARYASVSTALGGADLVAMGVPEGPAVGRLLGELLRARLDGEVDSAEAERRFVRSRMDRS